MDFLHVTTHLLLLTVCAAQESNFAAEYENQTFGPYRHIYPPVDITRDVGNCTPSASDPCPIFIAIMMSFGGSFTSSGVVPAMQLAIDQMNRDPYFLPGFRLHYALMDSQCNRQVSLKNFHAHLLQPPVKVGVVGSGCSTATEVSAEIGPFYNLTQVSCLSSSHGLANRLRFTHYFQVSASDIILAHGFFGVIKTYGWQRVGIITQEESLFTVTMDKLQYLLRTFTDIDVRERRFETIDGIDGLGENPFSSEARVFVVSMFPDHAMALLCRAYEYRMFYPRALFLVVGWYDPEWWVGNSDQQEFLLSRYGCTVEQRTRVMAYTLSVRKTGRLFADPSAVADSGINGSQLVELYANYISASSLNATPSMFYQQCYDATWAMGRALNLSYTELMNNRSLASLLAYHNSEVTADKFNLHHFTYNNSAFRQLMFDNLHTVQFQGIVGPIQFDEGGMRIVSRLDAYQYTPTFDEDINIIAISYDKFADIERESDEDVELIYLPNKDTQLIFPSGIPTDGIAAEIDVGIRIELTVIFITLAIFGSILAVIGMVLQYIHRKKVVVRLSSPNLNLVIGFGAIVLYCSIIMAVIPTVGETFRVVECNLTHWLTAIGYSMCYGTVLAKMARVYYIFDNPSQRKKKQALQDWMMGLAVAVLVAIDVVILMIYNIVEGVRGNLVAARIDNPENPEDLSGASEAVTKYFVYVCNTRSRYITLGVLYGYKMIPQVIALIFAFSIRKIKIKGLDDAKYIAFSVYISSLVTVIVIVIIYTLDQYVNFYAAVFCTGFFIGTTTILGLVMGPPIYNHYKDPTSSKVFPSSLEESDSRILPAHSAASRMMRASMVELASQSSGGNKKRKPGSKERVAELEAQLAKAKVAHDSTKAAHVELMASHSELIASHSELEAAHESTKAAHKDLMASHSELIATHTELETSHSELKLSHSILMIEARARSPDIDARARSPDIEMRAHSPDILHPSGEQILRQGRLRRNSEYSMEDTYTMRSRSEMEGSQEQEGDM